MKRWEIKLLVTVIASIVAIGALALYIRQQDPTARKIAEWLNIPEATDCSKGVDNEKITYVHSYLSQNGAHVTLCSGPSCESVKKAAAGKLPYKPETLAKDRRRLLSVKEVIFAQVAILAQKMSYINRAAVEVFDDFELYFYDKESQNDANPANPRYTVTMKSVQWFDLNNNQMVTYSVEYKDVQEGKLDKGYVFAMQGSQDICDWLSTNVLYLQSIFFRMTVPTQVEGQFDWIFRDEYQYRENDPIYKAMFDGVYFSRGANGAVRDLSRGYTALVQDVLSKDEDRFFLVAGHSLGGTLAQEMAFDIASMIRYDRVNRKLQDGDLKNLKDLNDGTHDIDEKYQRKEDNQDIDHISRKQRVHMITFGAPSAGNEVFVNKMKDLQYRGYLQYALRFNGYTKNFITGDVIGVGRVSSIGNIFNALGDWHHYPEEWIALEYNSTSACGQHFTTENLLSFENDLHDFKGGYAPRLKEMLEHPQLHAGGDKGYYQITTVKKRASSPNFAVSPREWLLLHPTSNASNITAYEEGVRAFQAHTKTTCGGNVNLYYKDACSCFPSHGQINKLAEDSRMSICPIKIQGTDAGLNMCKSNTGFYVIVSGVGSVIFIGFIIFMILLWFVLF
eukprot:Nk52_evm24s2152 gene=Nk52_evmTU24s2152